MIDIEGDCAEWDFPADPGAVRTARHVVREQLGDWDLGSLGDIAALLVSELVTNSLRHASGPIGVLLVRPADPLGTLLVEVSDPLPDPPLARAAAPRRRGRTRPPAGRPLRAALGHTAGPHGQDGEDGVVRAGAAGLEDLQCAKGVGHKTGTGQKASRPCCDRERRVALHRSAGYCGQPYAVTGAGRGELEGTVRVSEIPAKATERDGPSGDAQTERPPGDPATGGPTGAMPGEAPGGVPGDVPTDEMWHSSPPGSLYDYIKAASFSIGPDGLVDQWSTRAEQLFGVAARDAVGKDPIEAFVPSELRADGYRKMAEILDGREWTGVVPFRVPDGDGAADPGLEGVAEVYVMPTRTEDGERAAVCIVVDVRALRQIETDLASSQAIFGQSPFGFLLFDTDLRVRRANRRFADVFGGGAEDHRGRTVHDYLPRHEADRMAAAMKRVLQTGDPVTDMQIVGPAPGSNDRRHWSINLYRVHSGSGRPIGVAGLGTDVTRRHAAAREAAHARRNLALLNEAGARIGNSLDLETTARELLDVAVPGFCDLASVDLYQGLLAGDETPPGLADGSAELRRVAFASAVADAPFPEGAPPSRSAPCTASPSPRPAPTPCARPGPG